MPVRIPVIYPRYPRLYPQRQAAGARPVAAGRGGGRAAPGGTIDTSSTGNVGGDFVKAIGNMIQQHRMNAAANQLLNTQTPPRAAWVGGTAPAPSVSTAGTAPQTGGVGELQMQQQAHEQDLADQLQKAKIAAQLALVGQRTGRGAALGAGAPGGNAARWKTFLGGGPQPGQPGRTTRAGKAPAYEPGSLDPNTDPEADKFPYIQADFDAQYGKGAYAKIAPRLGSVQPDENGNYVVADDSGKTLINLPPNDANYWLSRINAGRVRAGQEPILADKFPSLNPNSGQAPGTQTNPYVPKNQLEARSLPFDSYFKNPDTGQIGQKLRPAPQQAPAPSGPQTSAIDTGAGGQTAMNAPVLPPAGQQGFVGGGGDQLASNTPPQPQVPPDLSIGVGRDQTAGAAPVDTGSQDLADAIMRSRLVNQFQSLA